MITEAEWSKFVALPKAELHVHLEGTLEPELLFELANKNNIELGYRSVAELSKAWQFETLPEFLELYYKGMSVLQSEEDFYQLAYHYFQRASHDGVVYCEVFFDPQGHTARGIAFDTVIKGIIRAQRRAEQDFSLHSNIIMCFLRDLSEKDAYETLYQALPWKEHIIGVGLDSDGYENPPRKFQGVFTRAKNLGFRTTMHAELDQKDIHDQIRECVSLIQVDRIDHGVNAADDHRLISMILDRGLALTACPISMKCCNQTYALDKIFKLYESGVRITINSDDPSYFRGYINDNFRVLADSGKFSFSDLLNIIRNAFECSWLNPESKTDYLSRLPV